MLEFPSHSAVSPTPIQFTHRHVTPSGYNRQSATSINTIRFALEEIVMLNPFIHLDVLHVAVFQYKTRFSIEGLLLRPIHRAGRRLDVSDGRLLKDVSDGRLLKHVSDGRLLKHVSDGCLSFTM